MKIFLPEIFKYFVIFVIENFFILLADYVLNILCKKKKIFYPEWIFVLLAEEKLWNFNRFI